MKRFLIIALLAGIAIALGLTSIASAQGTTPPAPGQSNGFSGMGRGMMGGTTGYGPMHEYMEAALAAKLGISVEELEDLHAQGKTFWQIAEEKGLSTEEAQQAMLDARSTALDKMVEDGTITKEQADWMKNRSSQMMGGAGGGCMGGASWNGGTGTPRGGMMGGRGRWTRDS